MPAPRPSALIDAVDDADRPIGQIRRSEALATATGFRVVHIFIFHPDSGDLLVQLLSAARERNPLKWGSSVAGYLHAGESYLEGAQRRLREELGLGDALELYGETWMSDGAGRKFITLYTARAAAPRIAEANHIAGIEFWPLSRVRREMHTTPERFTETFRFVFGFFEALSELHQNEG